MPAKMQVKDQIVRIDQGSPEFRSTFSGNL